MDKINYTYIVRCSDGTLYTGWTNAPIALGLLLAADRTSLAAL